MRAPSEDDAAMETMLTIGTSGVTLHWDPRTRSIGYVCRCGLVHGGPYGFEDFRHHECLHEVRLLALGQGQVMCPACGRAWMSEAPAETIV